ncbi:hypothetical protein LCGC14_3138980, partial [marine sediment metagenome]
QRAVVELREDVAGLRQVKKDSYEQWLADSAQKFLIELGRKEEDLAHAETALRDAALGEYEASREPDGTGGNKHPIPGTEIKVGVVLVYEAEPALAWALEHKQAVRPASLVAKEFENIVRAMAEAPDFVTMKEEAKANLASDMAKCLEGVGE